MAVIPNTFTQRGVLGGDSRSGCEPVSSLALGYRSSVGCAVLVGDDVRKGRISGSVMYYRPYRQRHGTGSVRRHRLA